MNLKKEILHTSKTFLIVTILFFAVQFIYAWTGPNLPPPGDNTETPINVSSTAQTKTGGLTVGGLTLPQGATITGNGTNSTYGATTIKGSKNSYSGINFKDSSNANAGTLMMGPSYSGFFNGADSQWRMYVIETGIANQMGNVVANDFYSNAAGKYMSQMGGGGITSLSAGTGIILSPNPATTTATISANTSVVQSRVTGTCPAGQAIMSISSSGTVTCTVAAAPTLRYYQCPNLYRQYASSYPCDGGQSAISYCNASVSNGYTACSGAGCYKDQQNSCTPVYQ